MIRFYTLLLVLLFCSCNAKKNNKNEATKPNIVFIFTDDQTYTSVGALGNDEIITPSLDKLVHEGTTFTHAYNMGSWSGAVCAASRAMIISGRFVWRANEFRQKWVAKDTGSFKKSWPKLLGDKGYKTYITGKWHVDAAAGKLFDNAVHIRPGMPRDAWKHSKMVTKFDSLSKVKNAKSETIMPNGYNRPKSVNDTSWSPTDRSKGGFWEGQKHWSEVLKDDAIAFIDKAKDDENPFFMYLAFNAPHDPRQAPKEYLEMYPLKNISVPKSFLPEYPFRNDIGNGDHLRDEALAPFPRTPFAIKTHKQEYYASISHLDAQIGLIIDALKKSGKMDNTYIFLTSDHGLAMGRHGLLGKQSLFDHSIRPPLVIVGPDIPKDKRVNSDVYLQDIMATSLEIAGVEKPNYVEFTSFLDIAKGNTDKSNYEAIYGAYLNVQRMIRKDGFKLLVYPKIDKILLFDLNKDPEEMNNIADNPANKDKVKSLFKDLMQLQKDMEDPLDISNLYNSI
ncbi:sulfatase-like hydrolase/transferase [Flavivirga amylovorans]|uniref:Sulfatase-like hydrolase/transferase n=1 Tax=Flavivirga amylovorans TaxID=870486 RepID=A0ABT8X560_9FLAO|nr:sulfatase-like hydrolase/transferase [Flavivirga amylovorans]MDO5988977.1 sulfatase-like hydrolase/transferase [Flavivirga amylovorans]